MRFKYPVENPTAIIELPGVELPLKRTVTPQQKRDFTLGGTPFIYDKGWEKEIYLIKLRLNESEKESLINFLKTIGWSKEEFLWEMEGFQYPKVVRFWGDLQVKWRTVSVFEVTFDLLFIRDELI